MFYSTEFLQAQSARRDWALEQQTGRNPLLFLYETYACSWHVNWQPSQLTCISASASSELITSQVTCTSGSTSSELAASWLTCTSGSVSSWCRARPRRIWSERNCSCTRLHPPRHPLSLVPSVPHLHHQLHTIFIYHYDYSAAQWHNGLGIGLAVKRSWVQLPVTEQLGVHTTQCPSSSSIIRYWLVDSDT